MQTSLQNTASLVTSACFFIRRSEKSQTIDYWLLWKGLMLTLAVHGIRIAADGRSTLCHFLSVCCVSTLCICGCLNLVYTFFRVRIPKSNVNFHQQVHHFITILTLGLLVLNNLASFYTCMLRNYQEQLLKQQELACCLLVVAVSFLILWVLNSVMLKRNCSVTLRRKLFHLLPVISIPIVYRLNRELLMIMLYGAFYLFLHLEIIRYLSEKQLNQQRWLKKVGLSLLYQWMAEFNQKRQKQFWFTHLYLYLAIIFPYSLEHALGNPHIGLVLIVADGSAALVGTKVGKHRIWGGKTLEGTTAFIATCFSGQLLLTGNRLQLQMMLFKAVLCGLAELFSGDADNLATVAVSLLIESYTS